MSRVCILGGGRVGEAVAYDLSNDEDIDVTVVDNNKSRLNYLKKRYLISTRPADLSNLSNLEDIIRDFDLVIDALPGNIGYSVLRGVVRYGIPICDVSFFPEDSFDLEEIAIESGDIAVVDCGIAPGLSNLFVGHASSVMDSLDDIKILVGGLPKKPDNIYRYKAPFSPVDVIEEYVRPARIIRNGRIVEVPALSECEEVDIDGIGKFEAFNTDGLRTLAKTVSVKNAVEKTLRFVGHAEKILLLKETGFFRDDFISLDGCSIRPIDLTSTLLFPMWSFGENEEDFTVMKITITGKKDGKAKKLELLLFDEYNKDMRMLSMSRTTGFTASLIARIVLDGKIREPGLYTPEHLGMRNDIYKFVIDGLRRRSISIRIN